MTENVLKLNRCCSDIYIWNYIHFRREMSELRKFFFEMVESEMDKFADFFKMSVTRWKNRCKNYSHSYVLNTFLENWSFDVPFFCARLWKVFYWRRISVHNVIFSLTFFSFVIVSIVFMLEKNFEKVCEKVWQIW